MRLITNGLAALVLGALAVGCSPPSPEETCTKLEDLSKKDKKEDFEFDRDKCLDKLKELQKRDADAYKCAAKTVKGLDSFDTAVLAIAVCDPKSTLNEPETKSTSKTTDAPKTDAPPNDEGKVFTSAAGKFSAVFPDGEPTESNEDVKGVKWFDTGIDDKKGIYKVSYADYADAKAASAAETTFLAGFKGDDKVTESKDLEISGHKAHHLTIKISERTTMWLRTVVVDKRFYKISSAKAGDPAKPLAFLETVKLN